MNSPAVRSLEDLTAGQRAGLHAAALHPHGDLPPSVLVRDLLGLVGCGLAEPVTRQPAGVHVRSPRCRITSRGRERAELEARPRLVLVPCSSAKPDLPVAEAGEMYIGSYHRAARRAAHTIASDTGADVLVVSAKFGLLRTEDRILHYDLRAGQNGTVAGEVLRRQAHYLAVSGAEVTVLAGKAYAALARHVWPAVHHPLVGARGIGDHLAFFASLYDAGPSRSPPRAAAVCPQAVGRNLCNSAPFRRPAGRPRPLTDRTHMLNKLFPSRRNTPAQASAPASAPAPDPAPARARTGVVDLTKKAAFSLSKHGLDGQRAAVYLVLDRSGSMRRFYNDGTMQYLGEQALGLSRALDDDGKVPVMFFSTGLDGTTVLELDNHAGRIDQAHARLGHMGRTYYTQAINAVIDHYQSSGATEPAFVLFQTDGSPDDRSGTEELLTAAKKLPMFWSFVGFGDNVGFLRTVDALPGIDNTGFFHVPDPHSLSDAALYDGITAQFGPYLAEARAADILG